MSSSQHGEKSADAIYVPLQGCRHGKRSQVIGWTLISGEDAEIVGRIKWGVQQSGAAVYVRANRLSADGLIWKGDLLHRVLFNLRDPDYVVDHINHDTLDNRRENLRIASRSENQCNSRKPRSNTSGFKGVCMSPTAGRFIAQIGIEGRKFHLGTFDTQLAAAQAYDAAAAQLHGEFALLNFGRPA